MTFWIPEHPMTSDEYEEVARQLDRMRQPSSHSECQCDACNKLGYLAARLRGEAKRFSQETAG